MGESSISFSVVFIGLSIALLPPLLSRFGFGYSLLVQGIFMLYGLISALGGFYRKSGAMGYFVDISSVFGLGLVVLGSPLGYPLGRQAWIWSMIGMTLLMAVPSTVLVIVTRQ